MYTVGYARMLSTWFILGHENTCWHSSNYDSQSRYLVFGWFPLVYIATYFSTLLTAVR